MFYKYILFFLNFYMNIFNLKDSIINIVIKIFFIYINEFIILLLINNLLLNRMI